MAKKPAKLFTTPKGTFKYPSLARPDYGTKDYPCPEGQYKTKIILSANAPETEAFLSKLAPLYAEAEAAANRKFSALKAETRKKLGSVKMNPLYTELLDPDTEEPTGDIELNFKLTASGEYKKGPKTGERWTKKPSVFDAKKNKLLKVPDVWSGTTGRVSFEVGVDYETGEPGYFIPGSGAGGLRLTLSAVQLIDVVTGGERSASEHGFGEEEGYEGSEEDENGFSEESGSDLSNNTAGGNDDF